MTDRITTRPAPLLGAYEPDRPPTRAERMAHPLTLDALKTIAARYGVCTRPIAVRRTDLATGQTEVFDLPCGGTRESQCVGCARRNKRLRQQQCRDGWHRDDEPLPAPQPDSEQVAMLLLRADFEHARADCLARGLWDQIAELDEGIAELDRQMTASGLRGHIPPNPTPIPDWARSTMDTNEGDDASATAADVTGAAVLAAEQSEAGGVHGLVLNADPLQGSDQDPGTGMPASAGTEGTGSRGGARRVRSTRRRQDAPDLPRRKVEPRTVGRTYTGTNGRVFRPSTFVTLTLPSYGRVRDDGSPVNPNTYDYRRAAWDAVHFASLLDRLWQNLRRAEGWNVQYFGAVEPQRRLAPHAHFAVRGAIARASLRKVIQATYHQVWWPSTQVVRYGDPTHLPEWDDTTGNYVDPDTREPLATWDQALDQLDEQLEADPDRGPEHVVSFGSQVNLQGVLAGTGQAGKLIGYLTKYLTKSVSACHPAATGAAEAHQRRLWEELRVTPCSSRCPNWLRYGIQPEGAREKMAPGYCRAKVHQAETLGIGGRRVLVSRQWTGKSLADQRWDQRTWVRNLLRNSLGYLDDIDPDTQTRVDLARQGGYPAPIAWDLARPGDPDLPDLSRRLMRAISAKIQHRNAIRAAKANQSPDDGTTTGGGDHDQP
jgi:hypothetical protein